MMKKKKSRRSAAPFLAVEALDARVVPSGAGVGGSLMTGAAEVSTEAVANARTTTALAASAGTLGQPITFTATVRAAASAGSPQGVVDVIDHGRVLGQITLAPSASTNPKYAYSTGSFTLNQPLGSDAYYFGKHPVSARFLPDGAFSASLAKQSFTVARPPLTTLAGGVGVATTTPGSGPQIQSGQAASVIYTGYLAKNGKVFDSTVADGGSPFSFTLGAGDVIPGFDSGVAGMQAGETRIIAIPPAEGYGNKAAGPIPGHSTLIFVVTLESIS